jgi:hypothetical protein
VSGARIPGLWRPRIGLKFRKALTLVTVRTFLRALGLIYFTAFTSFGAQAPGLIGSRGILPFRDYLGMFYAALGQAAYWDIPTLLWLSASDGALAAVWIAGSVCALLAVFGRWQRAALAVCLVLWLSLCSVGQDFLAFQWDLLLVEAGFLAIFADASGVRVWLFRWLVFRLIFSSGAVKLLSHDATWRNLTALHFHYETQPLPTPPAWYMYQLPMAFQRASTAFVLAVELLAPFLFFGPKRVRHVGAWLTIGLQVLILLTGNYAYFNWLTIALAMFLFIEPDGASRSPAHTIVSAALAAFVGVVSGLLLLEMFSVALPAGGAEILHAVDPLRMVNSYGLFAVMTTTRPEIVVEGSDDGVEWKAYEFRYKPGDAMRAPPVVAPHQPRLDWQMWFAALGSYPENRWFVNFMKRLLEGSTPVLRLLGYNPFPHGPPRYIRARVFLYEFTNYGERAWWRREDRGFYFPPASLK